MRPEYKKVRVMKPHCPVCGNMLFGDNSMINPWRCPCGEWHNTFQDPFEYEIKKESKDEDK